MAEFLNTEDVSSRIIRIINESEAEIWIMSPYLSVNNRIRNAIDYKVKNSSVNIHMIYRHEYKGHDAKDWLESIPQVKLSFCERLHAKCYFNEKEALLTSMNLYEYSQINNYEMGILVSREHEPDLYNKIIEESKRIENDSETVRDISPQVKPSQTSAAYHTGKQTESYLPESGFCIRCKADVPITLAQPYCQRHIKSQNRYKTTRYCHICGKGHRKTLDKPACLTCYNKYKNILEFATLEGTASRFTKKRAPR